MHRFLTMSATRLAELVRTGRATSREIVDIHVAHMERVNPVINAVVASRFDAARAEADAADARVRAAKSPSELPPFLGVPCTIKESFLFEGMPNTAGLVSRIGTTSRDDAITVARLRAAGAIPLGVTNVSELCLWMETNNRVYGLTRNPYDPSRIVGGSSGGEGAIVGSAASPFGLGSDIGGSIRMPAFFNGVFGHKATPGLVPNSGQWPLPDSGALRMLSTGPICRRAEDLHPLLRVLAGPDGHDPLCRAIELRDPATVDLSRLRVIEVPGDGRIPVSPEMRAAQRRAAHHLEQLGARVTEQHVRGIERAFECWAAAMHEAAETSFAELLGGGEPVGVGRELLRWAMRRSPHTLPALATALAERATDFIPDRSRKMLSHGRELRARLHDLLGDDGVILYPSYPVVAPRHFGPLLSPFQWVYTAVFNVAELAVTQVPLGLGSIGIPTGVQVAAAPERDHLSLAVAVELEKRFGGWVMPRVTAARAAPPAPRRASPPPR